jgi:hypothetical protein
MCKRKWSHTSAPLSPLYLFMAWTVKQPYLYRLKSLKNTYMFTRAHHWTLYFPRQFSPIHTPYALRLFKIRLIGICCLFRDFPRNSVPSAQLPVLNCAQKTCASFSCHFPSPRLNLFSLSFFNESECCIRPDFLSYTPLGMNPVRRIWSDPQTLTSVCFKTREIFFIKQNLEFPIQ